MIDNRIRLKEGSQVTVQITLENEDGVTHTVAGGSIVTLAIKKSVLSPSPILEIDTVVDPSQIAVTSGRVDWTISAATALLLTAGVYVCDIDVNLGGIRTISETILIEVDKKVVS